MIATGLLWYDDDTHHSLAQKLAEAAERYRERLGFEPTTCQLNPALIPAAPPIADAGKPARRARASTRASEPAIALRLVANEHLRPNYFFVGVEVGEPIARVPGWRDEMSDEDRDSNHDHATRRAPKAARPAKTATAAAPLSAHGEAPPATQGFPPKRSVLKEKAGSLAHKRRARQGSEVRFPSPAESATDTSSPASAPRPRRSIAAKVAPALPAATPAPATEVKTPASRQRLAKSEKPAESATGGTVKATPTGTRARIAAKTATAAALPSPARRGAGGEVLIPAESATTSERGKRTSTVPLPALRQSSSRGRSSEESTATKRGRKAAESATTVPTRAATKVAIPEPAPVPTSIAAPRKRGKNGNIAAAGPAVIPTVTPASRRTSRSVAAPTSPTPKRRSPASVSHSLPAQPDGPLPAQATLWSDAPSPVRPARKRRSA